MLSSFVMKVGRVVLQIHFRTGVKMLGDKSYSSKERGRVTLGAGIQMPLVFITL
jgi:hypothetical protein